MKGDLSIPGTDTGTDTYAKEAAPTCAPGAVHEETLFGMSWTESACRGWDCNSHSVLGFGCMAAFEKGFGTERDLGVYWGHCMGQLRLRDLGLLIDGFRTARWCR